MVFPVKLYLILAFVECHTEMAQMLGAIWCQDGAHFVSDSKTLTLFLRLHPPAITLLSAFMISPM
jgi:hypothetical protein